LRFEGGFCERHTARIKPVSSVKEMRGARRARLAKLKLLSPLHPLHLTSTTNTNTSDTTNCTTKRPTIHHRSPIPRSRRGCGTGAHSWRPSASICRCGGACWCLLGVVGVAGVRLERMPGGGCDAHPLETQPSIPQTSPQPLINPHQGPAKPREMGVGPLRMWPGGLCVSRSIGDMDTGPLVVPLPHVRQVGGRMVFRRGGVRFGCNWQAVIVRPFMPATKTNPHTPPKPNTEPQPPTMTSPAPRPPGPRAAPPHRLGRPLGPPLIRKGRQVHPQQAAARGRREPRRGGGARQAHGGRHVGDRAGRVAGGGAAVPGVGADGGRGAGGFVFLFLGGGASAGWCGVVDLQLRFVVVTESIKGTCTDPCLIIVIIIIPLPPLPPQSRSNPKPPRAAAASSPASRPPS